MAMILALARFFSGHVGGTLNYIVHQESKPKKSFPMKGFPYQHQPDRISTCMKNVKIFMTLFLHIPVSKIRYTNLSYKSV